MRTGLAIIAILTCIGCTSESPKTNEEIKGPDTFVPPAKQSDTGVNGTDEISRRACEFSNPDTSLAGVIIQDPETSVRVLGTKDTFCFGETYCYYSKDKNETAFFTMHPGDSQYSISEFEVIYSEKEKQNYRALDIQRFKTESNIRLGIKKDQVLKRFGKCDAVKPQPHSSETIYYVIEDPNDSKTGILSRYNMPIYYSEYEFKSDTLVRFKFGFAYP